MEAKALGSTGNSIVDDRRARRKGRFARPLSPWLAPADRAGHSP